MSGYYRSIFAVFADVLTLNVPLKILTVSVIVLQICHFKKMHFAACILFYEITALCHKLTSIISLLLLLYGGHYHWL